MFKFLVLAYKNLKRRRIRSLLTIAGVAVAVAVLVSLLGFQAGYRKALTENIEKMGYHILVTAKGCPYEAATLMLKGGAGLRYMEQDIYKEIVTDPDIEKIAPMLIQLAYDPNKAGGKGGYIYYLGIEKSYLDLKPFMEFQSGGWFSAVGAKEAIMGYEAAELEQRQVGDKIFIPDKEETLTVVGILKRTGTQDDGTIFLPLATTQQIFGAEGKLTGIGIKLKQIAKLPEFEERLYSNAAIQVISLAQVKNTILNLLNTAQILIASVAFIAIFVALIGVVNTILISVFERTQEIGIMKAVGASRWDIFKLIWLETLIICFLGALAGDILAVFGGNLVEYFVRKVLPYVPAGKIIFIDSRIIILSVLGAIAAGILAGALPALKAASARPLEAIRSEIK